MLDHSKRFSVFSSSKMYMLTGSVAKDKYGDISYSSSFYKAVKNVYYSRKIGRRLSVDVKNQSSLWGHLMEAVLFSKLGLNYEIVSNDTIQHPIYEFWSGTPDLKSKDKVGEIKCFYPAKFIELSECLITKDLNVIKNNDVAKVPYWQVVSNAIILNVKNAEIISFMPRKSELFQIIEMIRDTDFLLENGLDLKDYYFLSAENIESLPYLPDNSDYESIVSFEFEVPVEDKKFLTKRVIEANRELMSL